MIQKLVAAVLLALSVACANSPLQQASAGSASSGLGAESTAVISQAASNTVPVGNVEAELFPSSEGALDVGVVVFDEGLGVSNGDLFPTVRKAESLIFPTVLADYLTASNALGVVRVVPSSSVSTPLQLQAQIVVADGQELELAVTVLDAGNGVLLRRKYRDIATAEDYPVGPRDEPFADLYQAIANDVGTIAAGMDTSERKRLERLAAARFASEIAPEAYGRFLSLSENRGTGVMRYELVSFPAEGDPMLRRLRRMQRQEALFVDTADEQYRDLFDEVRDSYNLWREYSFELERFGEQYRAEAAGRKSTARRGSFAAMQQGYASFRKVKIQEEDLSDLVNGFTGESLETVLSVDDGVFRLQGSVDERYAQWRRILTRINELEVGIDPNS
ncbi:MAG: hypothetical protein AAF098_08160 [Pseudomonadota bacterium]